MYMKCVLHKRLKNLISCNETCVLQKEEKIISNANVSKLLSSSHIVSKYSTPQPIRVKKYQTDYKDFIIKNLKKIMRFLSTKLNKQKKNETKEKEKNQKRRF